MRTWLGYEEVFGKELLYFTMLRKPVDRYLSNFYYQNDKMGFDKTIEEMLAIERFSNFMTKRIAGKEDIQGDMEILKRNYSFVGLMESFDESLILLNDLVFKNKINPLYERKNVTKDVKKIRFENLNGKIQRRVIEVNRLYIELYAYVKDTLYLEYKRSYSGQLIEDPKTFKIRNEQFRYNSIKYNSIRMFKSYNSFFAKPIAHKWA